MNSNQTKKAKIIAEIGCNHKGDFEIAKEMVKVAAEFCKVDIVKFQKRNPKECLSEEEYNAPHPVPCNAYGNTYGAHREFLEFNVDQHRELKQYCEELNVDYSSSVWDLTSAREIVSLEPKFIKVPSAHSDNFELLEYLCENFPGEIHLSVGMTTKQEIEEIIRFFERKRRNKDLVLFHCISGYPIKFDELSLLEISRLKNLYHKEGRIKAVGFSGHHLGIAADIAALSLGVEYIERHFTLDRTWKGTDHAASLEPQGLRTLVRDVTNVSLALEYKKEDLLEVEKEQRRKLKWKRHQEKYIMAKNNNIMVKNNIVALIPLRGGSKSIPLKNIKLIAGKPLAFWVIEAALGCPLIDKVFVSTDSDKIKKTISLIQNEKLMIIGRSEETATDTASTESVMMEFAQNWDFNHLVLIQATSPLLKSYQLKEGITKYIENKYDSLLSVVRQKRFIWKEEEGVGKSVNYSPFRRPLRQEWEGFFVENGAFYITSRENLIKSKSRISGKIGLYEMPEETYIELDDPSDWTIVEALLLKKKNGERNQE